VESLNSGEIKDNSVSASHHLPRKGNSKFGVFTRYFELINTKSGIPNFYNILFGGSYRHYFKDDKSLGVMASIGSSSDKPFKDNRDGTILINSTYQLTDKWVLLGNYSNNRTFLNNVPLPGFIYIREQSRESSVMLGFPFVYILKPFLNDRFSFKYIGILPYNHRVRLIYNRLTVFRPYIGIEQGPVVFFESNRSSDGLRTFWFERKSMIGIEKSFGPFLKVDFQFGNSFNREYFNARSYSRRHSNVQKIHDGTYGALNLKSSF
jgi:hypothetical protein